MYCKQVQEQGRPRGEYWGSRDWQDDSLAELPVRSAQEPSLPQPLRLGSQAATGCFVFLGLWGFIRESCPAWHWGGHSCCTGR